MKRIVQPLFLGFLLASTPVLCAAVLEVGPEGACPDSRLVLVGNVFRDDRPNGRRLHAAPSVHVEWRDVL